MLSAKKYRHHNSAQLYSLHIYIEDPDQPEVIKIFMLHSTKHEIYHAHKC